MNMTKCKKVFSAFMSFMLAATLVLPSIAYAAQPTVNVDNHTTAGAQTVSNLVIDGVDAPSSGKKLDSMATVTTAEGVSWDIPVLWISNDLQLATEATEGHTYLPALAFFVPQEYALQGDTFTVTLSDTLTKLFGSENAVSVYDAKTGITYILPLSLKDFFVSVSSATSATNQEETTATAEETPALDTDSTIGLGDADKLVDVFCAKTARNVLSDEDLEWLINLVLNTLEPQAVNLLLQSFPSFKAAAAQGNIGKEIGLYIYYKAGDKDGKYEHESADSALAYVNAQVVKKENSYTYSYMIGIDVDDLLLKQNKKLVKNESTGKYVLVRSGDPVNTLNNTIVHELFHAFQDDYIRPGMLGAKNLQDGYYPNNIISDAYYGTYLALHLPRWFIEGSASAVENNYQFRNGNFKKLRGLKDSETQFQDEYTRDTLLHNYLNATSEGKALNFDLEEDKNDSDTARYTTGYLATLYLSQLAAQKDPSIKSAMLTDGTLLSDRLRLGLDSILRRMHNGETFDAIIKDISSIDGDPPIYNDTADFEVKFIKGAPDETKGYRGDNASMGFTLVFLNYMRALEKNDSFKDWPNGSLLFPFDKDFVTPLDFTKTAKSDYYKIVNSNEVVPSTVPASVAFASAGKSDPSSASVSTLQTAAEASDGELPLAAKDDAQSDADEEASKSAGSAELAATNTASDTAEATASDTAPGTTEATASDTAPGTTEATASDTAPGSVESATETASSSADSATTETASDVSEPTVAAADSNAAASTTEPTVDECATVQTNATETQQAITKEEASASAC